MNPTRKALIAPIAILKAPHSGRSKEILSEEERRLRERWEQKNQEEKKRMRTGSSIFGHLTPPRNKDKSGELLGPIPIELECTGRQKVKLRQESDRKDWHRRNNQKSKRSRLIASLLLRRHERRNRIEFWAQRNLDFGIHGSRELMRRRECARDARSTSHTSNLTIEQKRTRGVVSSRRRMEDGKR